MATHVKPNGPNGTISKYRWGACGGKLCVTHDCGHRGFASERHRRLRQNGQTECFTQFMKRRQSRVACDLRSMELEFEPAVKLNTRSLFSPVTHWMPLSEQPETLELLGEHARIMPSGPVHLGNPSWNGFIYCGVAPSVYCSQDVQ